MSLLPAFTFANEAHWAKGLSASLGIQKLLYKSDGTEVPGIPRDIQCLDARDGELWFIDRAGHLRIGDVCGPVVVQPERLVVGESRVWVLARGTLVQFDRSTAQQLINLPASDATSMAGDGKDGIWVLRQAESLTVDGKKIPRKQAVHIAGDGRARDKPIILPNSVTCLANAGMAVVTLDNRHIARITGDKTWSFEISDALRGNQTGWTDFTAQTMVNGSRLALVEGYWGAGDPGALLVDPYGAIAGMLKWQDKAPNLIALDGAELLAQSESLYRFSVFPTESVIKLTPALAPEALRGAWLRAEVDARLPRGATLTLRWASIPDQSLVDTASHTIAGSNSEHPAALRIASVGRLLSGHWCQSIAYQGLDRKNGEPVPTERFSFAMHATEPGSTVFVELKLETDSAAPEFVRLSVIHDAEGLMSYLPAIYRAEGDGDGTMRRIVGVIESTTHSIDETIARLATLLDPMKTPAIRLPALAAMLDLPFDEALPEELQRALVAAGPKLLETRGTRAGIAALLEALFPNRPYRIVDLAAGLLATTLNATTLPGLLLGPASRTPKLNARLVLNKTRICVRTDGDDGRVRPRAEVAVTIPSTFVERRKLGPALRQMLTALLPAGLTLKLDWSAWRDGMTNVSGDVLTIVDGPDDIKLDNGQALGAARVGGRRDPRIPPNGFVPVGHRLL